MEENLFKIYDKYELKIEDIKPKIIDTIIEVYGEKNRAIIEDRLNRIYIVNYLTLEDLKYYLGEDNEEFKKIETLKNKIELKYEIKYFYKILKFMNEEDQDKARQILLPNLSDDEFEKELDKIIEILNSKDIENANTYLDSVIERLPKNLQSANDLDNAIDENNIYCGELGIKATKVQTSHIGIAKMIDERKNKDENCQKEVLEKTTNYLKCQDNLKNLNLILNLDFKFNKNQNCCMNPNMNKNDENCNIVFINGNRPDVVIIHEILHAINVSIIKKDDKKIQFKCEFDCLDVNINRKDNKRIMQKYEMLSENIHHEIAIKVTEKLHDKGKYFRDKPEDSKVRAYTEYENITLLTGEFLNKFGNDLIDGMINQNIKYVYEKLGKENFDKYNEIVNQYCKNNYHKFFVYPYLKNELEAKKNGGQDTERTLKFEELKLKASKIIEDMEKNHQNIDTIESVDNVENERL